MREILRQAQDDSKQVQDGGVWGQGCRKIVNGFSFCGADSVL